MSQLLSKEVDQLFIAGAEIRPERNEVFGDDRGYFLPVDIPAGSKRAYLIENHDVGTVRAFHGHRHESKTLLVLRGAFKAIVMSMDTMEWKRFALTERGSNKLAIPPGAYNGFCSLSRGAQILITSDRSYEESIADDHRLPFDFLGDVWHVEHR